MRLSHPGRCTSCYFAPTLLSPSPAPPSPPTPPLPTPHPPLPLQPLVTGGFLASPYFPVDPSSNTSFHFAPELCYYTQTSFGAPDIGLDLAAAAAWYGALTYDSTSRLVGSCQAAGQQEMGRGAAGG